MSSDAEDMARLFPPSPPRPDEKMIELPAWKVEAAFHRVKGGTALLDAPERQ